MSLSRRITAGLTCVTFFALGGCPMAGPERTTNQGGGNILSATSKIVGGQMTNLTPDELQIAVDTVSNVSEAIDIELTDEQAQAAVDFLVANSLNSIEDIEAFVAQAENDPDSVQIPESLQALIDSGTTLDDIGSVDTDAVIDSLNDSTTTTAGNP